MAELREQAEPVVKAARERAEKARGNGKRSRSKKPFLFLALLAVGAVVAYMIFRKRDNEPAYLMEQPDEPDASPANEPSPGGATNGTTPTGPAGEPMERASAYRAAEPAQPSPPSFTAPPPPPPSNPPSSFQPSNRAAAWDLPSSSIPPVRGVSL